VSPYAGETNIGLGAAKLVGSMRFGRQVSCQSERLRAYKSSDAFNKFLVRHDLKVLSFERAGETSGRLWLSSSNRFARYRITLTLVLTETCCEGPKLSKISGGNGSFLINLARYFRNADVDLHRWHLRDGSFSDECIRQVRDSGDGTIYACLFTVCFERIVQRVYWMTTSGIIQSATDQS
jgi:hypothetical protein